MKEKIKIEFFYQHYGAACLFIDGENTIAGFGQGDVTPILEKVSSRLYSEYCDGCNIFEVSQTQLKKIKDLIEEIKNRRNHGK